MPASPFSSSSPRAFISYARADGERFASALRDRLEREHPEITLWQDRARMEGGVGWWKQITAAIDEVTFLIMVMTPATIVADVARKEWRYARQQGVRVCPVFGVPSDQLDLASFPRWMNKVHFYDLDREWDTFVAFLQSTPQANRVPFMAPDLPADFIGRPKEFDALLDAVLDRDRVNPVAITTALQGAGGFGKTTLATALCHNQDVIAAFDDGILWVTLGESPKIQHELTKLYAALTGERPSFVDADDASMSVAERLDQKNCLIVIDDVWDPNHVRPFFRGGRQCARLITTRRLEVVTDTSAERVLVDQMTDDQSVRLLAARLSTPPSDLTPLRTLATRLGEWPLLLKLAGSQLRERIERGDSLEGALTYVSRALDKRGPVAFDRSSPSERNDAVTSTLGASLQLLSTDDRRRCTDLAVFRQGAQVPLTAAGALWRLDDFDTEEVLQRLDSAAIVDFDLKTGTLRIHGVLQAYLRSQVHDIAALHRQLATEGWSDPYALRDAYAWRWYAWHLSQAGESGRLRSLLHNVRWLDAKLRRTDVPALLQDFDGIDPSDGLHPIHEALRLAADALAHYPDQLSIQLRGRLTRGRSGEVDHLLDTIDEFSPDPWLQLTYTSLTRTGGSLIGILKGHKGAVSSLAVSRDGQLLVTGSSSRTVRTWDIATGHMLKAFVGHRDPVRCVALTSDGTRIVSGSDDRTIRVWDVESGQALAVLRGYTGAVQGISISPDGRFVVSVSEDTTLRVWDLSTARGRVISKGVSHQLTAVQWMPDGAHVAFAPGNNTVVVMSVACGDVVTVCQGHESSIWAIAVDPQGSRLVSASADRTLRVFDAASGETLRVLTGHTGDVDSVVLSHSGHLAVSGSFDKTVRLWDLVSGESLGVLEGHADFVRCVGVTPDEAMIVSGASDGTVRLWRRPEERRSQPVAVDDGPVSILSIAPDGTRAASGVAAHPRAKSGPLVVWDVGAGRAISTLDEHRGVVTALRLLEDGLIVSGSRVGTLRVGGTMPGAVRQPLVGHTDGVLSVALSGDRRRAVSLGRDRTVRAWDLETCSSLRVLCGTDDRKTIETQGLVDPYFKDGADVAVFVDVTLSEISRYAELALSPDGRRAIVGDGSGILAWDLHTGHALKERLEDFIVTVITMASNDTAIVGSRSGWLKVWDVEVCATRQTLRCHEAGILDVAVNPERRRLVTAGLDNALRVWSLDTLDAIGAIDNPVPGDVTDVAVAPDTSMAFCVYGDTVLALDLEGLRPVGTISFDHRVTAIAVSADGARVAVGDERGGLHFLRTHRTRQ